MKRAILIQEIIRRFLNTSEVTDLETKDSILLEMAQKIRRSGYKSRQIKDIISSEVKGYTRKWGNGEVRHRRGRDTEGSRRLRKFVGKTTWYKVKPKDTERTQVQDQRQKGEHRRPSNQNKNALNRTSNQVQFYLLPGPTMEP